MSFIDDLANIYEREMREFFRKTENKNEDFITFDEWLKYHGYSKRD